MSLKKRKRKHGKGGNSSSLDKHHFLYMQKNWSTGVARELREHPYCSAMVSKYLLHREIHEEVLTVPVPPEPIIREVLTQLQVLENYGEISLDDSTTERLETLIELFDVLAPLTTKALKRQLVVINRRM